MSKTFRTPYTLSVGGGGIAPTCAIFCCKPFFFFLRTHTYTPACTAVQHHQPARDSADPRLGGITIKNCKPRFSLNSFSKYRRCKTTAPAPRALHMTYQMVSPQKTRTEKCTRNTTRGDPKQRYRGKISMTRQKSKSPPRYEKPDVSNCGPNQFRRVSGSPRFHVGCTAPNRNVMYSESSAYPSQRTPSG